MATKALITAEQYLATHFEREPEFVHGELVERTLPNFSHGSLQLRLGARLEALRHSHPVYTGVEVRMQMGHDLIRTPDIAMWTGPDPPENFPANPPLLVVEVNSPDDRFQDVLQKLEEYRAWGVQHIWLVEPELKRAQVYSKGSLTEVQSLELPQFKFAVKTADLFS